MTTIRIFGVSKTKAMKARRWLAARSLATWYNPAERSLNAFEFKWGREWTYNKLHEALEAVR